MEIIWKYTANWLNTIKELGGSENRNKCQRDAET